MGLAARWAAWEQRRTGGLSSPASVSGGDSRSPVVEIYINEAWTDISGDVRYADKVKISRGRANESSNLEPSTCSFTLDNRDGRYSPRNPLSPHYGQLGRNTACRVYVIRDGVRRYRFHGEISEWPNKWDISGTDVYVPIQANGITRRLSQNAAPLRSTMFREFANPARSNIVSYWPMEDGQESTQIAASDNNTDPMAVSGTAQIGSYSDWTASDSLPVMGSGKFIGRVRSHTATGEISVRLFVYVQSAVAAETSLLQINTTGTASLWDVRLGTTGNLRTRAYDSDGTSLLDSNIVFDMNTRGFTILDLELTQNGSDIDWRTLILDFNNTDTINDSISQPSTSGTVTGQTIGRTTRATVGADQGLTNVVVGHLAVADDLSAYASTAQAIVAYNGENPSDRMTRMCREEDVPFTAKSLGQTGNLVTLGDQRIKTLIEILQEAADTDLGRLHEDRDQNGIVYRSRLSLYAQDAAVALSYANHELAAALEPVDDDQNLKNDIAVTRIDGSSYRTEQTTGTMSTATPPDGVGRYSHSVSLSMESDSQLADQAGWRLHLGTVDESRYPQISLHLSHSTWTGDPQRLGQVLSLDVGDRVTIDDLPAWQPPDQISLLIEGYSETIDQFEHLITLNCSPESPYQVAFADGDEEYTRADTEGSSLATGVSDSATSLSVATTSGPLWSTADTPYDVMVGGERMTVTAVTGSSSPQTFTVTRSVNGVVKAQTSGTEVRLVKPAVVQL